MMRVALCLLAILGAGCTAPTAPNLNVILADAPAETLDAYGLFIDPGARDPAKGVVSYDLINPLFSDHADKHRFVYVPDDKAATYRSDDVLAFPVGSVLVKTFAYDERYLETRLLIHKPDGWEALPYIWDEAQTVATYAPVGDRIEIAAQVATEDSPSFTYVVPNKNQCKTCHQNGDAVHPIGPKARNLNHQGPYGRNQIEDWVERGIVDSVPQDVPVMARAFDPNAPLDAQARAYLDINCAHCHKRTGSASNSGLLSTPV